MDQESCYKHDDEPAIAHCKSCEKPLCLSCAIRMSGHIYCSEDCSKAEPKGDEPCSTNSASDTTTNQP